MMSDDEALQLLWESAGTEKVDGEAPELPQGLAAIIVAKPYLLQKHLAMVHKKDSGAPPTGDGPPPIKKSILKSKSPSPARGTSSYTGSAIEVAPAAGKGKKARVEGEAEEMEDVTLEERMDKLKDRVYTLEAVAVGQQGSLQKIDMLMNPAVQIIKPKESSMKDFYTDLLKLQATLRAKCRGSINHFSHAGAQAWIGVTFQGDAKTVYDTCVTETKMSKHIAVIRSNGVIRKESESLVKAVFAVIKECAPDVKKYQTRWPDAKKPFEWSILYDNQIVVTGKLDSAFSLLQEILVEQNARHTMDPKQIMAKIGALLAERHFYHETVVKIRPSVPVLGRPIAIK